ncbi:cilia- and flagella-associated protein 97 [Cyprinodon tularosa]|uniref:cilia- and flagella-associated protein 97 n=1 Tax=Cyprinodon tularosa TaxID=77115 RepID=UPI0018E208F1|nr:cilia- and flagella-associated protein 97 [Cyprinodon tularosa]
MLNPDELEGEVDHSFFDSDCHDDSNVGQKTIEEDLKGEKQNPGTHNWEPAKPPEHLAVELSPGNERTGTHLRQVEINKTGQKSDVSSYPNEAKHEGSNPHSKRPSGAFLALLANMPNAEENQSVTETGKGALAFTAESRKKNPKFLRKKSKNVASVSKEANIDSESCCSTQSGNSHSKPIKSVRRKARGPAESQDLPNWSTDESSLVSEVTPPFSPEPGSQEADLNTDGYECSFRLESQLEKKLVLQSPIRRPGKNYTFSRTEVQRIDLENQRLLQRISNAYSGIRLEKKARKKINEPNISPVVYLPHSALNRQRKQRRIDEENLALLKKLESTKPSPWLSRTKLLADHQRLKGYVGASSYPASRISCSRTRNTSSALRSSTALSSRAAHPNSSSTSAPSSSKLSSSRPAWC